MKLLVLHAQLGTLRGGGENFSRNLFTSFTALGHQVSAAFAADPRGRYPFALPPGVETLPVPGIWPEHAGQATLSWVARQLHPRMRNKWDYAQAAVAWRTYRWNSLLFQRRVMKRIEHKLRDVDAVYVHSNPYLASELARRAPTVLRLPGPLTAEMAPVLRQIHAVCANGDALERMRTFLGERALELPVGLDVERFSPGASELRATLGWNGSGKVVGYVGRLSHIKGVDVLADGFRRLSLDMPGTKLLIAGTGEEERNVRAVLASQIASGAVHMAGDVPHDRLTSHLRAMDVLVMPSRYENYSNAVLEGLSCGVPFVGSNVGGNIALHKTGAGWLFTAGSAASLASTLSSALGNDADRAARGARGRAHVSGRYSWLSTARRLEEIINALSGGRGARSGAREDRPVDLPRWNGDVD